MSVLTESRYLFVFVYMWQLMAALYRAIHWFVIQRTSRIGRLAYKLEQLNAREQDLSAELARLNEDYIAKSSEIQARRNSNALERAKVLEELAQCSQLNGVVKAVPVVKCDAPVPKALLPKVKVTPSPSIKKEKPKPVEEKKQPALQRSTSLTVAEPTTPTIRARSKSPLLASRSLIFERPRTPEVLVRTPVMLTRKTIPPAVPEESTVTLPPKDEEKEVNSEQTNSFSKLTGLKLANHRVNEYIDLVLDSALTEFRSCDDDRSSGNKRSQRFRATIKELYGDPEWRPFINDLKRQYKLFCYL